MLNLPKIIKKLNTPKKVQDFLDKIPFNFEKDGETYWSPRQVLEQNMAHCFEGALLAHFCLTKNKIESYLLDLKVKNIKKDSDHTLCVFRINGFWGAISKTNHSVLRWRDPIYKSYRELAISYFHEYFLDTGEKTLLSFSKPFNVFKKFGEAWAESNDDLDEIAEALDASLHFDFVPKVNKKYIRKAGQTEIKGASIIEWKSSSID
jgi:hypothetical protein